MLVVEAQQPRDVDHPVVHRAPLGVPRHGVAQPLEQRVGAVDPARPQVDPGAVGQFGAPDGRAQRPQRHVRPRIEEGRLEAGDRHSSSIEHLYG